MSAWAANLAVAAAVLLAGIAATLSVLGTIAYQRTRQGRLLWISGAFLALAVVGVLYIVTAYQERGAIDSLADWPVGLLGNMVVVFFLYIAVFRK